MGRIIVLDDDDDDDYQVKPRVAQAPLGNSNQQQQPQQPQLPPQQQCVVCLTDEMEEPSAIDCCDHQFCRACIQQWANVTNKCPLCLKEFRRIRDISAPEEGRIANNNNEGRMIGRRRERSSIGVPTRRQQVRYEDTGMGMVDPFLRLNNPAHQPQARQQAQQQWYGDAPDPWADMQLFDEYEDHRSGRGVDAYRRQSLQNRLLAAVYEGMNGIGGGGRQQRRQQRRQLRGVAVDRIRPEADVVRRRESPVAAVPPRIARRPPQVVVPDLRTQPWQQQQQQRVAVDTSRRRVSGRRQSGEDVIELSDSGGDDRKPTSSTTSSRSEVPAASTRSGRSRVSASTASGIGRGAAPSRPEVEVVCLDDDDDDDDSVVAVDQRQQQSRQTRRRRRRRSGHSIEVPAFAFEYALVASP